MTTTTIAPPRRIGLDKLATAAYRAQIAFDGAIDFDPPLRELVKIRASQLNGCAYCVDMHARDALAGGEPVQRVLAVTAWRESPLFTTRERAALAVCDAVTQIGADGLSEDVYAAAQAEFDDAELAGLILAVAAINTWNRVAVSTHMTLDEPWPES